MKLALLAAVALATSPAVSQDTQDAREMWQANVADLLSDCLKDKSGVEARSDCIGRAAAACQQEWDIGSSHEGRDYCLNFETIAWNLRLGDTWVEAMDLAMKADAIDAERGKEIDRDGPLMEAQRAWMDFLHAECRFVHWKFGGDPTGNVAETTCRLNLTARRALEVEAHRDFLHEGF